MCGARQREGECGDQGTASQSKSGSTAQNTCPGAQEVSGGGGGIRDRGVEGWRGGGVEGWRDGGVEGWRDEESEEQRCGRLERDGSCDV